MRSFAFHINSILRSFINDSRFTPAFLNPLYSPEDARAHPVLNISTDSEDLRFWKDYFLRFWKKDFLSYPDREFERKIASQEMQIKILEKRLHELEAVKEAIRALGLEKDVKVGFHPYPIP